MPSKKSGTGQQQARPRVTWPMALRNVRAWLTPWTWLWRYWRGWTNIPPPVEMQHLLDAVGVGYGLNVYNTS